MAKEKSHSSWSAVLFQKSPMNKRKDELTETTVTVTKTKTDACEILANNKIVETKQTDVTKTSTTTDEQNNNEITKTKSETDLTCTKMHRQQKHRLSLKRLRFVKKSSSSCSLCREESGSFKNSPKVSEKSSSKVTTKGKSKQSKINNEDNTQPTAVLFDIIQYKDLNLLHDVFKSHPHLDINAFNEDGIAAIHFAAMSGSTSCVEAMVNYGADINLLDIRGNPPLHYAILMKKFEFAGKLMELGAVTHQLSKHQYPELKKKSRDTWHF